MNEICKVAKLIVMTLGEVYTQKGRQIKQKGDS